MLARRASAAFATVGDLIGRTGRKQAIGEAMRVGRGGEQVRLGTEPWKIKDEARPERLGTILHAAAQSIADRNPVLAPFLPLSAKEVDRALGNNGELAPCRGSRRSRSPIWEGPGRGIPDHHR